MNKEQQELLDEAFKNYLKDLMRDNVSKDDPNYILLSKEEFINKCKTDTEFSEKWGLKIEERELSLEERATIWNNTHNPVGNIYTHNQYDENDIPTKLITITYNDKTIESYE
jgi:aspartate/methionine/tyrosine aminotransferase